MKTIKKEDLKPGMKVKLKKDIVIDNEDQGSYAGKIVKIDYISNVDKVFGADCGWSYFISEIEEIITDEIKEGDIYLSKHTKKRAEIKGVVNEYVVYLNHLNDIKGNSIETFKSLYEKAEPKRDHHISLKVYKSESDKAKEKAKKRKCTVSELLRDFINQDE